MELKNYSISSKKSQGGFTLMELIIGLTVMTLILLATGVFSFSGAQSKSTNIMAIMKELGNGALRYNAHTGMFPKAPISLFDKSKNTATDVIQGVATTDSWKGPYTNVFGADANGKYKLDAYVAGATITFEQITAGLPSGATAGYRAVVDGIPDDIIAQIVADCNGTAVGGALPTDHAAGQKCTGALATGGVPGSVAYLFSAS
jgi:prepilin-type N-terminal cleavage/methylation domain-containing protein